MPTKKSSTPGVAKALAKSAATKPAKKRQSRPSASLAKQWAISKGIKKLAHIKAMLLQHLSQEETNGRLRHPAPAGSIEIPYFDLRGKPTGFCRYRFDTYKDAWAKVLGRKPRRYAQPSGSGVHVYFSPFVDWTKIAEDTSVRLFITEGEAKAACVTSAGLPCVGLGGVASWRGTKAGLALHPELLQVVWDGREVVIVYDSDAATNPDVQREENMLASALVNEGARVKVLRLPEVAS